MVDTIELRTDIIGKCRFAQIRRKGGQTRRLPLGSARPLPDFAHIVFRGIDPEDRAEDAQDILGIWPIVPDHREVSRTPADATSLELRFKACNASVKEGQSDKQPGSGRRRTNRAGSAALVASDLVAGTQEQGFGFGRSLETPFPARSLHDVPCRRGPSILRRKRREGTNHDVRRTGAEGEERIIVPTVHSANHPSALKALSQSA